MGKYISHKDANERMEAALNRKRAEIQGPGLVDRLRSAIAPVIPGRARMRPENNIGGNENGR